MTTASYDVGGLVLPRPFKVQRFGHLGLTHGAPQGGMEFWCNELGFRLTDVLQPPAAPKPMGWFSTYGADHHALLHLDAVAEQGNPDFARGVTVNQIAFQVGTLSEVADGHGYFEANGIKTWRYGRDFPGSNWAVYCFDPDGLRVELFYGMEQIGWDRRSKPPQYYVPPEYVPHLPEPAELSDILRLEAAHSELPKGYRPIEPMPFNSQAGGVMMQRPFAINKLGPVHLFVDDVSRSEAFYVKHLGLVRTEEVTWRGHRALYLRHGSDHHTIGLFPMSLRDAIDFDSCTKLFSFGIELGSYKQLVDAVTWLKARGHRVRTDVPPELRPGIDYAAFVTDPSGHSAMLYCGIEQIGWDGKPRPADQRRAVESIWPDTLDPMSDSYMSLNRQGPMA